MEELIRQGSLKLAKVGEALGIRNLDPESGLIFVPGAGGVIGHRVALRLLRAGYPQVRLGTQNPDSLEDLNKMGAEIADFAWNREDTYLKALKDVKSVLLTIAYTKDWKEHFPVFIAACKKAGVKHIVKISFYHARLLGDAFQQVPLVRDHGDCDRMLIDAMVPQIHAESQMDTDVSMDYSTAHFSYTILYTSHFMSNPFLFNKHELREMKPLSTFFGASANKGVNYVSPNDVAEVAVRALLEPKVHYNQEYTLTGRDAIPEQQVADLIGKHLQKAVMYVDQPLREFTNEIMMGGDPDWMVQDLTAFEKIKASGTEENKWFPTDDIEKICGHKPETFEEYLMVSDMMTPLEEGAPPLLKPLNAVAAM